MIFFRSLSAFLVCYLIIGYAQAAERHYTLAHFVTYNDNVDRDENALKSNTTHRSSASVDYQDVLARMRVDINSNFQYEKHTRNGLNSGASADGGAAVGYAVIPGFWNVGLRNVAVYSRDFSRLSDSGNEEQSNTFSYDTDFGFDVGSSSNIFILGSRSRTDNDDDTEFDQISTTGGFTFQRNLSPRMSLDLVFSYSDTAQLFNGVDLGASRLQSQTIGLNRILQKGSFSISAGKSSPVGMQADRNESINYSVDFQRAISNRFNLHFMLIKNISNNDEGLIGSPTITNGLSEDKRADFDFGWDDRVVSMNINFFYGESISLDNNVNNVSGVVSLAGVTFGNDIDARFYGWGLFISKPILSSLTISSAIRMETRESKELVISTDILTSNLEFSSLVGETKQFMMNLSLIYTLSSSLTFNASVERRIDDEQRTDTISASFGGAALDVVSTLNKPNTNVFNLGIEYRI